MELQFPSLPFLFTFLLFLVFMLIKKAMESKPQYTNSKLPPGPWKLPLIGSMHHLLGLPHHSLRNLAKKHGPLMHLKLGELSCIVVSSPKMAKEVMKTHDLMFVDRPVVFAAKVLTYGCKDVVFSPYGDYWRQLRKLCVLEILSTKRVQSFQTVREEEVSNLVDSISSVDGSPVNLTEMIFLSTNDITARAAFGKKCKDKQTFLSALNELLQLAGGFSVADIFPSRKFLHVISGMKNKVEEQHKRLDRVLEDIIKEHKENWKTNKPKQDEFEEDLVDVLLRLQEDGDLEFPLAIDNLKAIILDMFGGGSETSSTAVEWAMSELLRNPRVMEKAQAEVRQVLNLKMKETDIDECNYLKSVIKETLRLHPPAPLLIPRQCRERCTIDGYEIPIGTRVIVNAWAIGRDPEHWIDAERFEPERFQEISVDYKGTNFEYIPFGAGRRICPGMLFGVANIELMLAQLLYHFDWKLPNGLKSGELDMTEAFGVTVRRKNELYLIPTCYSPLSSKITV